MAILKCKMCGGELNIQDGMTVAECEYCGTTQTLPKLVSDDIANLYDRANHFRRNNEFDKAEGIYERILSQTPEDAEAYWSLVLCRYGIEYVEDPVTHKRVPTVNRAQYTSIFDDENYKSAIEHADAIQRRVYEEEAAAINEIQKGILAISQKEEPFDVFICYKETDFNGRRTPDSVLATDLYHQLTNEGFKVFFSRITLEDKLGTAYEPYIFAALNSAKVMVVLGTKPEYFNAVWVKNEWSRYLAIVKQSNGKKVLIPAYRDMDPYDLPEEFSHLQAQDMSKLGFMQDLIRGIKKITKADEPKTQPQAQVVAASTASNDIAPLLKRMFMYIEDGEWDKANEYAERVLDKDPENAEAYLGKLMVNLKVRHREDLKNQMQPFENNKNYQKAIRFAGTDLKNELKGYITFINNRNAEEKRRQEEERRRLEKKKREEEQRQEEERRKNAYDEAVTIMNNASTEDDYKRAEIAFYSASGYKDADALAKKCNESAETCRKDSILCKAKERMQKDTLESCFAARNDLKSITGWKDADDLLAVCETKTSKLTAKKEEKERIAAKKKKKRVITFGSIAAAVIAVVVAFVIVLNTVIIPNSKYNSAISLIEDGKYVEAYEAFIDLNGYKDSDAKAKEIYGKYKDEKLKNAKVDDYVVFGSYEQDNNTNNGKEDIEWLVLAKEGNKALVISRYALDSQQYDTSSITDTTWETCSLREWLNGTFISNAFSSAEQNMIQSSTVTADKNPSYSTSPGNNTTDKVFLLSIPEANKYFSSDSARQCSATAYAKAQGAYTNSGNDHCWWWLRSPGNDSLFTAIVRDDGSAFDLGRGCSDSGGAVRPALWINLES